jgi:molecular chaperone GrpE (heat shock protein)
MSAGETVETSETAQTPETVETVETSETSETVETSESSEVELLRRRIAKLETELVEIAARASAAVAAAQTQTYWLERWHVDLNALMRRPGVEELRLGLRAVRSVARSARRLKRRLRP